MNQPFVSLRSEITRNHAYTLMAWLEDERVTRYLNDSSNVSRFIEQAVDRTPMPVMTHLFNQGGRFFMVYDRDDRPTGFVRLVKTGAECEIVLVIGDHDNWGRRLGASAIQEGLKLAFFDMRARNVVAKIHPANQRSMNAFVRCGFVENALSPELNTLTIGIGRYLRLLRDGRLASSSDIYVTEMDQTRIMNLIASDDGPAIIDLEHEIERAVIVDPQKIAGDVVTMNSRVEVQLDGDKHELALVYPQQADEPSGKISVLSEIGAAILGYQEGSTIDWVVSDRTRRISIAKVIYQPEASGDFHL